ncbi:protein of unknown function [Oenococcus oeni]|nr:hypothetical protein OENI_10173 [Oenococcus oeni]SYW04541.1 hypothetical protein OENI_610002 [Oenococcus oeni]SYW19030.1 hypothetical protein OENI_60175 [Oenococcus oeni]VDC15589.1 protein of unknown function [Oenococcus oeni]
MNSQKNESFFNLNQNISYKPKLQAARNPSIIGLLKRAIAKRIAGYHNLGT